MRRQNLTRAEIKKKERTKEKKKAEKMAKQKKVNLNFYDAET